MSLENIGSSGKSFISEGEIITGRSWRMYESLLGLEPTALKGERVLNFGAGGSHLGKETIIKNMNCQVVDLDLKFDPKLEIRKHPLKYALAGLGYISAHLLYVASKFLHASPTIQGELFGLERQVLGMRGRHFIRGDGRALPFSGQTFDHILALWSTYQIPDEAKETVYKELMRVGKVLHIGPIFGNDYRLLEELAPQLGFELVACQPLEKRSSFLLGTSYSLSFAFTSAEDYDDYVGRYTPDSRIITPERDDVLITKAGTSSAIAQLDGGSTIVLRRFNSR